MNILEALCSAMDLRSRQEHIRTAATSANSCSLVFEDLVNQNSYMVTLYKHLKVKKHIKIKQGYSTSLMITVLLQRGVVLTVWTIILLLFQRRSLLPYA